jgi:hypothetical protein
MPCQAADSIRRGRVVCTSAAQPSTHTKAVCNKGVNNGGPDVEGAKAILVPLEKLEIQSVEGQESYVQ